MNRKAFAVSAVAFALLVVGGANSRVSAAGCDGNACNCVLYARCRVPRLPFGLTSYADKARVINSRTPSVGSVAVMNIYPPYGHVAVVEAVYGDGRIQVREANYVSCRITPRTGTPSQMSVAGYFRP